MLFRRFVSEGLAHFSYLVGDGGDAVVIDPRRDVDAYLDCAERQGVRIRWVVETHRNEDYAIGSTALAEATGAEVLHSKRMAFSYGKGISDGDTLELGRLRLRMLETPGHTDESLSYALSDTHASDAPVLVFTGDALFVGDVGRTDLCGPAEAPRLAATLWDSLQSKVLPLGDHVILCPAHGGGSVCGGSISDRQLSTLGFERLSNAMLRVRGRDEFVARKVAEKQVAPPSFKLMEEWNRRGTAPIHARVPVPPPLSPGELAEHVDRGAIVIDARMPQAFAGGHIPRSYNVWFDGLAGYLGWVATQDVPLVLVLPEEVEVGRAARILYRMGFDRVAGWLRGGFDAWQNAGREVERLETITTAELATRRKGRDAPEILDVRKPSEWDAGTIPGARKLFVGELEKHVASLPRERPLVAMCSVGHRGGLAASILARHGFRRVANHLGGFKAWKSAGLPIESASG